MERDPNDPPDEEIPAEPDGVEKSPPETGGQTDAVIEVAEDGPPMEAVTEAVATAKRMANAMEAVCAEAALAAFDGMLLEEESLGAPVESGDLVERAFALHLSGPLQLSPVATRLYLAAAREARASLPATWEAFHAGACGWRAVRVTLDIAVGLGPEERALFDVEAAGMAGLATNELRRRLLQLRNTLDPAAAAARSGAETKRRHVAAAPDLDGQATLTFRGPATDIAAAHGALHRIAVAAHGRDGETRALGALMFDAGMDLILHGALNPPADLADPGDPGERLGGGLRVPGRRAVQPQILVTVLAATATGVGDEPASLAGFGEIGAAEAQRIIAHTQYWTRITVDPVSGGVLAVDDHERYIPSGLRKWLQGRDGTCRAPGCGRSALRCDLDHTFGFACGGHTTHTNLASLCRSCHRIKEQGDWHVVTKPDGTQIWTSRWGTTRITEPVLRPVAAADDEDRPPF